MKKYLIKAPEYLIYLFVFLLPWSTRYIFNDQYSLYGLDILFLIILIFFIIFKKKSPHFSPFLLIIVIFWIINFFNLYWSQDKELSFYYLMRLAEAVILVYVILRTKIDFKKLALVFVGAGVLQSILGMVQFATQKAFACKWLGMAEHLPEVLGTQVVAGGFGRVLRAYGSMPHPNILGMFLAVAIILNIYLYLKNKNKYLLLASLIILQIGLLMTFSRQAWLGLCLGLLILLILHKPRKIMVKLLGVILVTSVVFVLIYSPLVLNRFNFDGALENYSIEQRAEHQDDAFKVIKKYWPIGIGLGNYTAATKSESVHNIYLLIFSELGFLGLAGFLMVIILFFYYLIKNINKSLEVRTSAIIIIVLLVLGCFDHYLWTLFPFSLFFWLWLAIFYRKLLT